MQKKSVLKKKIWINLFLLIFLGGSWMAYGQTAPLLGDVNNDGVVNIVDALMIAQYYVGNTPAGFIYSAADVDLSGQVSIIDALIVAQYYVGLIPALPPGSQTATPAPSRTNWPSRTVTRTPTPSAPPAGTPQPVPTADNPFANAIWYKNPEWSEQAIAGGGSEIAYYNTGVWLRRIADITEGTGLRGHLDNALSQRANMIMIVLNDIQRDCKNWIDSYTGNSKLVQYTQEFIEPIAAILSDTAYRYLRKVIILEPEVLANLVTNMDIAACYEVSGAHGYIEAFQYALNRLNTVANIYVYFDIAHSAWLGWDNNFVSAVEMFANCIKGTTKGVNSVAGFISNAAGYVPVTEPFLHDPNLQIGGKSLKSSAFYEWNNYFCELPYAQAMRSAFIGKGFPETIGMLIGTSRNGWGGADRPTAVSTSTDLDTYVNESRIDRRLHRGNWCNQPGGIGERPRSDPAPGIDAFVWAMPPGVSDGISAPGVIDPLDPNLTFDMMCDPDGQSKYNSAYGTGAIPAPHAGRWNQLHFDRLLNNAYPPLADRADNPFENARGYVNPDWADLARNGGGAAIANNNTAIWLDKIAAITAGRGLSGHLDAALAQGANLVQLVIYNLPNRNCSVSNGELKVKEDGINRYRSEFIDPIAAILSNPAYKNLRIVIIIEPNSLPNLISGYEPQLCYEVNVSGAYTLGIQYALNRFNSIPNVYCYMDAALAGWLGWDSNFGPAMDLISRVIKGAADGVNSISGLITNVAGYVPLEEPFLPDDSLVIGGNPLRASGFYEYNQYFGEKEYALAVRNAFISKGFPATIGMLIDTSRNGWGGPGRPTAVSTSGNLNTYVNESRIDRRLHRGNWCNQPAGIGEQPRADPAPGIDAYVWAWPPGMSDGASSPVNLDPLDTTIGFDRMCDPDARSTYNPDYGTGALSAPHFLRWNQAHFELLLKNIHPKP